MTTADGAKLLEDPSSWAWLQGRKAESFTYELSIQAPSLLPNPFAKTYVVVAKIGKEEHFVMKLPAGEYEFKEMRQRGFSTLASYIGRRFTVPAGVTSHAGRLVVAFPERMVGGTAFASQVDDVQDQTIASLRETYGDVFTNVVKAFGKHTFAGEVTSRIGSWWYRTMNIESNQVYYVRADLWGASIGVPSLPELTVVDSQKGSAAIKNLRRVSPSQYPTNTPTLIQALP